MFGETPNERMARLVNSAPVYLPYDYQNRSQYEGEIEGVIRTQSQAVNSRNAGELGTRIKAASGKLTVAANSSDLIVALNNTLRFSVTRNAAGNYEITDRFTSGNLTLAALVAGAIVLTVVLSRQ